MTTSLFICGKKEKREDCAEVGCIDRCVERCRFELRGKKAGQHCMRQLCDQHGVEGMCPGHHRLMQKTLSEALLERGYSHRPANRGMYCRDILDDAELVVFTGTAHETWTWLQDEAPT